MDEPKPDVPQSPDSTPGGESAKIPVNVSASSAADLDDDAVVLPTPGQVVTGGTADPAAAGPEAANSEAAAAHDQPPGVGPAAAPDEPEAHPTAAPAPSAPTAPLPQAPVPRRGKGSWIKAFLLLVIIVLLAAGGYLAYQKNHHAAKTVAPPPVAEKDIPMLKIGVLQANYGSLYPQMSDTGDATLVNAQLFEGLVRYEAGGKIAPDLATKWTNPDNKTWIFTLESGVKFHDGHTLTANDVKYSLDTIIAGKSALAQAFAGTIASVDAVGANQVKITTSAPDPALLNKLASLYIIDANMPSGDEPSQAGTGPYEIKPGTTPSDSDVQMVAFDGYHDGRPTTRALEFGSADSISDLLADYKSGQFNIVGPLAPSEAKSANQFVASGSGMSFIGFNTVQAGPLQNKQVREAVRDAVDAAAIGKAADQAVTPDSQLLPASVAGYNSSLSPHQQNVAKAKQLLAQAGYPNGLSLRFSTADSAAELSAISSQLKQAGITLTADQHSDPAELASYVAAGKAQLYDLTYPDSDSAGPASGLDVYTAVLPTADYVSSQFNSLVAQAGTTVDQAKQTKILQSIATLVDNDIPVVPLYSANTIWLTAGQYNLHQSMLGAGPSVYFYQAPQ